MSAIHGVDDIHAMPAHRFFTFAERLPAYTGVMQLRAHQEQERAEPRAGTRGSGQVQEVPDSVAPVHSAHQASGQFPAVFEVG